MSAVAEAAEATDVKAPSAALEAGLAMLALLVALLVGYGWFLGFHLDNVHNGLLAASFSAVGLYVVRMRPRHREGWLLVAVGVVHAVMFFGRQYGRVDGVLPAASWVGWVGVWLLPLAIALFGWTFMAFPDGRMLSPGWRRAGLGMCAIAALMAVTTALWPVDYDRIDLVSSHPLALPGSEVAARLWPYLLPNYALFQVLWTAAVVVRLRRARGDEARQMRWLVYAIVMATALLVTGLVAFGSPAPGRLAVPLIPVAAGVGILKYRLYDIDPVVNKTLVIGFLVLVVTVGYVALVVGVGALIPVDARWLSLLATAVVAVAFEPLRRRAQRLADRLVYGHRATPYEALSRLSAQLDEAPEALLDGIAATVANAVGAIEVSVWVGEEARLLPQAGWPGRPYRSETSRLGELDRGPPRHVRPVVHRGTVRGAITLRKPVGEALTSAEDRLLDDLVAQTGLVIAQQQQARELQATARRIVTAQDAARHRIERDLHDGAQQRLVTMGLELGSLAEQAKATSELELAARVSALRAQLLEATADLRELARGLHPMVLSQAGLQAALRMLADRSSIPVRLTVALAGRMPREIEATAYYVVSEALTNAARHSGAAVVTVEVAKVAEGLQVRVSDDGCGGARQSDGSGLQGLADRLAAVGATLTIDSPVGGGTRIPHGAAMRVIIADDAVLFREGMARILTEVGFTVTGQARNGAELVRQVRRDAPDVVITDLRMPPDFADEGIEAAAEIRSFAPNVGLMLLSQYVEVHHALRLMDGFDGAVGYLLKDRVSDLSAFAVDVRRVAAGQVVIDQELVSRLVSRRRERDPLAELTERERQVLGLMAQGLTNAALSEELLVSLKTVEGYIRNVFTKLGLQPGEREHRRVLAVLQFLRQQ